MDLLGIGSIFNAGANLVSTGLSIEAAKEQQEREQKFNAEQAQLNRDWQTEEREAQNEWNLAQWNRNNEYNSLSAQIQRAIDAGVNPNAVIGAGVGVSANPAQGSNIGSGAQASTSSIAGDILDAIQSAPQGVLNGLNQFMDAQQKEIDIQYSGKIYEKRLAEYDANIHKLVVDGHLSEAQAYKLIEDTKWVPKLNNAKLRELNSLVGKYNQEVNTLREEVKLKRAQTRVANAQEELIEEQTETETYKQLDLVESAKLKSAQQELTDMQFNLAEENVFKERFMNDFRDVTGLDPNTSLLPAIAAIAKSDKYSADEFFEAAGYIFGAGALTSGGKGFWQGIKNVFTGRKRVKGFR